MSRTTTLAADQTSFVAGDAYDAFLSELVRHGLLVPCGVPGVFGRGAVFEDVVEHFDRYVTAEGGGHDAEGGAEVLRFPPVINRKEFERSGYLKSFPHLAGSVHSFGGTEAQHAKLLRLVEGGGDWAHGLASTDVVLTPAACYPVYPLAAGTLRAGGRCFDVMSYCFRHEPSNDPARMQMFRMREYVRLGEPRDVQAFRDAWLERGSRMLAAVGLDVHADVANDPFFGRGGRMLAANQREQSLKFELLVPICSTGKPTAVVSCNYHQDHFAKSFGIRTAGGELAHTACVGFGLERIALALFKTHGVVPSAWPAGVRATLGL